VAEDGVAVSVLSRSLFREPWPAIRIQSATLLQCDLALLAHHLSGGADLLGHNSHFDRSRGGGTSFDDSHPHHVTLHCQTLMQINSARQIAAPSR
jgi:hypothetical protein